MPVPIKRSFVGILMFRCSNVHIIWDSLGDEILPSSHFLRGKTFHVVLPFIFEHSQCISLLRYWQHLNI